MQNVVLDKPYRFVPPRPGAFWPNLLRPFLPAYLRRSYGLERFEFHGLDRLRASRAAGHGIMLAPNHCRPCDPMVLGQMAAALSQPLYVMASWHLFMQGGLLPWLLPRLGVFSVYREGLDREALKCAIRLLAEARRPLVVFPEGVISRTNDRLNPLMDGTALIARGAAKQRRGLNPAGQVVIHPVAIRYFYHGEIERALTPVLEEIEARLSWQPQRSKALVARIVKVGDALLTLKELEYAEQPRAGTLADRLAALLEQLLAPLEAEWLHGRREGGITARVKALRAAILPDLVAGDLPETERERRWRQLADLYLAQQIFLYPPGYFDTPPTPEQLLETVERFEEDLTDRVRVHRPLAVTVAVGEALEVEPGRARGSDPDPIMVRIRADLERMLAELKATGRRSTAEVQSAER